MVIYSTDHLYGHKSFLHTAIQFHFLLSVRLKKRLPCSRSVSEITFNNLGSSNWKERLESINQIYSAISSLPLDSPAFQQSLIRLLSLTPGFKESNVQVREKYYLNYYCLLKLEDGIFNSKRVSRF